MTCAKAREILDMCIGTDSMPKELSRHLSGCDECTRYWRELSSLLGKLDFPDEAFATGVDSALFVGAVQRRIDVRTFTKKPHRWLWPYAAATAVMLLVIGSMIGGYRYGRMSVESNGMNGDELSVVGLGADSLYDMNEQVADLLLSDVTDPEYRNLEDRLIDYLSEEDLKRLEESFSVGDLL